MLRKDSTFLLSLAALITGSFMSVTSIKAAQRCDALVLINSDSPSYSDFQCYIQPYLDNFGVPHTLVDIATTPIEDYIGEYAVIIIGHRQLDPNNVYLDATEQAKISAAVRAGTGLVNFDNDLSADGNTGRYQFVQDIFGFGYETPAIESGVIFIAPADNQDIQINCWEDNHQNPVLVTTTTVADLKDTDGKWTEFHWVSGRPFPSVDAGVNEENYGLPVIRFYTSGIANGEYEVIANLYTSSSGNDLRYYYGFTPDNPKAHFVDTKGGTGGAYQFAEYSLGTVNITDGSFNIYVRDADLLCGSYPYFGWAWIRLVPIAAYPNEVKFNCWEDNHQNPVLVTTTKVADLKDTDGKWTEFHLVSGRPFPSVDAGVNEENYGLPVMQFYTSGVANGQYEVIANLYTEEPGHDMRYYYGYTPDNPKAHFVDTKGGTGGAYQFTEYSLGTIDITDGTFNIYVRDADLLHGSYPYFSWAWIRLVPIEELIPSAMHYITALHENDESIDTDNMRMAGIKPPTDVNTLAWSDSQPFVATTTSGNGRAVQWGTYDWMSHSVKGPVYGLDDFVWRSIVWAARKPFVMQCLPNFVTMRVDMDEWADGSYSWVEVANEYGFKPWLGLIYQSMGNYRLPVMRFYTSGIENGQYEVIANLYISNSGNDLRYYYGFTPDNPKANFVDTKGGTGGSYQFNEYSLGTINITNGNFNIYVRDADLLKGTYPYFGWAWIRLVPAGEIKINCWEDNHQDPVLVTTTKVADLKDTDGKWTEFHWVTGRPFPCISAGVNEENYGLPVMRFYSSGIKNGQYEVIANLYTSSSGNNLRYYYGFTPDNLKAYYVDIVGGTGGSYQFNEYSLGTINITNGNFNIYVRDADLLKGTYPYFGWAWIRLVPAGGIKINCWEDNHQNPVLVTTTNSSNLNITDGKWTEYHYVSGRPYPSVTASVTEAAGYTDIAKLSALIYSGNSSATVHAKTNNDFFYYNHNSGGNFSDAEVAANFAEATAWHVNNNIPISKFALPHYYEFGTNIFQGLSDWGVEFVGTHLNPGTNDGSPWIMNGPYRLYESGYSRSSQPMHYADFLTVPGHPEFDGQFFNCLTEIRDETGYEWYPNNDTSGSIGRGTRQLKRALDSMVLATLFTHGQFIQPIKSDNWRAILKGITTNIAAYNPTYVTMDYACQYVRAMYTSDIISGIYDPNSNQLTTILNGDTDLPTKFYLFTERDNNIQNVTVDVPTFSGSTEVVYQLSP